MKKLLVLTLVLGLATVANAFIDGSITLQVSPTGVQGSYTDVVDSQLTLLPSQSLWIGVNNSVAGIPGTAFSQMGQLVLGIQLTVTGYTEGGDPIFAPSNTSWTGNWQQYKPPLVMGAQPNVYNGKADNGDGTGIDWWMLDLSELSMTAANGIGILDAKELHCDFGPSEDTILLMDATSGTMLDTLTIHQGTNIPEPVTIVLLGLGGLLLRRRK